MKKIFLSLTAAVALLLTGCEMNTSDNGDLDGFWMMTRVDSVDKDVSVDTREQRIFWAVQSRMLEMRDMSDPEHHYPYIIFRFERGNGTLTLSEPIASVREISDSIVTSAETVAFYGLHGLEETFNVERLDNEKMVLRAAEHHVRFHFRKY